MNCTDSFKDSCKTILKFTLCSPYLEVFVIKLQGTVYPCYLRTSHTLDICPTRISQDPRNDLPLLYDILVKSHQKNFLSLFKLFRNKNLQSYFKKETFFQMKTMMNSVHFVKCRGSRPHKKEKR